MFEHIPKLGNLLKRIWIPVSGLIGVITIIVQFVELWRGNQEVVTWVTATLSLIVLISFLSWVGFSKSENSEKLLLPTNFNVRPMQFPTYYRYAQAGLLLLAFFTFGAGYFLYNRLEVLNKKVVVLVTKFDGPDTQKYRVTEIIWENIYSALKDDNDVELVLVDTTVSSFSGAASEGKKYNASIVIWGWYSVTNEVARVTTHFDILNPPNVPSDVMGQETMRDFKIGEFQNFSVQEQLSEEMTFLSLTTIGLVRYSLQDWEGAIDSFNNALNYTKDDEYIKETQYYIDLSNISSALDIALTPDPGSSIVFVASQNIPQGIIITRDMLGITQVRLVQVQMFYAELYSIEGLIGKYAKYPIDRGVILTHSMVADSIENIAASGPDWASLIPPGMTAIQIPADRIGTSGYPILTSTPSSTP